MTLPHVTLWVDPGKMTGVAAVWCRPWFPEDPQFSCQEFGFESACDVLDAVMSAFGHNCAIGWERFTINSQTHKKTREGTDDAMHMIGVCRYLTVKHGCRFLGEAQQHTPNRDERKQLERLGWWKPGKDDAQSAAAHMLRYLVKDNELAPAWREQLYTG